MLFRQDRTPFNVGRARFFDDSPGAPEATAKIYVRVEPQALGASIAAQVDTGAAWTILETEVAEALGLLDGAGESVRLRTRYGLIGGRLERTTITLLADEGESLDVDATVFVSREWLAGTFLGYGGFLQRIRFAIDPEENFFYFGAG